jgi:hypothetical protein
VHIGVTATCKSTRIKEEEMPPLDVTVGLNFPEGLSLLGQNMGFVNQANQPFPIGDKIPQPVIVTVPEGTEYVHIAVIAMDCVIKKNGKITPLPISRVWYELAEQKFNDDGQFTCIFQAHLHGQDDPAATWIGYFTLEVLCFGKPKPHE